MKYLFMACACLIVNSCSKKAEQPPVKIFAPIPAEDIEDTETVEEEVITTEDKDYISAHNVSGDCLEGGSLALKLDPVFFDFDSYQIKARARFVLDQNAYCLNQDPAARITLEGHCDERGTQAYNLGLGQKRAQVIMDYMTRSGIHPSQLNMISKGENEPVCEEQTEDCWAQNRRVEFMQH